MYIQWSHPMCLFKYDYSDFCPRIISLKEVKQKTSLKRDGYVQHIIY